MSAQDPVDLLLGKVANAKKVGGNRWMVRCPAHQDDKNSLQITRGQDGRALLKCFAGCSFNDIVGAVGLQPSDMFADDRNDISEVIYDYRDEQGALLYQVIRKPNKQFAQRRPDGRGGWAYSLGDVRRVPYRLPELLAAPPDKTVFIVEGEKDADRLSLYRLVSTTKSGGAGNWPNDHNDYFAGRHVVIIPDNDEPGRKHAQEIAWSLFGAAENIKVIQLPNLPPKGDVSDWLNSGGTLAALKTIIDAAPEWSPDQEQSTEVETQHPWTPIKLTKLVAPPQKSDWIWRGYLAPGNVTMFSGIWKGGKSTLLGWLLKSLDGTAEDFAGQAVTPSTILVVSEENPGLWVTRRDELGLGDHVSVICEPFPFNPTNTEWGALLQHVGERVADEQFSLVIFDSLPNLWSVKNENDNAEVKAAIMGMSQIKDAGAAVLLVAHHSKSAQGEFRATRGAGALMGKVDCLMEYYRYVPDDENDTRRVLKARGRWGDVTPTEVVLSYVAGYGFDLVGTRSEAASQARKLAVWDILPIVQPGMTVEEILLDWPEDTPKPVKNTLERHLAFMVREGVEIQKRGDGTRHNPFTYYRAAANAQWQRTA